MKHCILGVALVAVLLLTVTENIAHPSQADAYDLWTSPRIELWGANVYQSLDFGFNRAQWWPLLRLHDLVDLKRAGASYVNFSIPGPYDSWTGRKNLDDWKNLMSCVSMVKQAQLKVVIAFRTAPGRDEADFDPAQAKVMRELLDGSQAREKQFIEMWVEVANALKAEEAVVGFDLLVEPHAAPGKGNDEFRRNQIWRKIAEKTVEAIRATGCKTPILVEPDSWAGALYLNKQSDSYPAWSMPENAVKNRLVCAVHQYTPHLYTEEGTEKFDPSFRELRKAFEQIRLWKKENPGIPVCVNEYGLQHRLEKSDEFLAEELRLLNDQKLNHAIWLWQVSDPLETNHTFNVRSNIKILKLLMKDWNESPRDAREARNAGIPSLPPRFSKYASKQYPPYTKCP